MTQSHSPHRFVEGTLPGGLDPYVGGNPKSSTGIYDLAHPTTQFRIPLLHVFRLTLMNGVFAVADRLALHYYSLLHAAAYYGCTAAYCGSDYRILQCGFDPTSFSRSLRVRGLQHPGCVQVVLCIVCARENHLKVTDPPARVSGRVAARCGPAAPRVNRAGFTLV